MRNVPLTPNARAARPPLTLRRRLTALVRRQANPMTPLMGAPSNPCPSARDSKQQRPLRTRPRPSRPDYATGNSSAQTIPTPYLRHPRPPGRHPRPQHQLQTGPRSSHATVSCAKYISPVLLAIALQHPAAAALKSPFPGPLASWILLNFSLVIAPALILPLHMTSRR